MKINCLSCGHKVDLDDVYDDYEGEVKCFACGATLHIKTQQGHLKSVNLATAMPRGSLERVH
jgi:ribosomal protein S27E